MQIFQNIFYNIRLVRKRYSIKNRVVDFKWCKMCVQIWNCWEVLALHLNMYRKEFKYLTPNFKINPLAYRFRRKKKVDFLMKHSYLYTRNWLRILFILHHKPAYNCLPSNSCTIIIKKWHHSFYLIAVTTVT